jgi:hypothetical protein
MRNARTLVIALLLSAVSLRPASAADPLASLRYLVGSWKCTYDAGKVRATYAAAFAYDMSGNWMRERDSWAGGGGDLGMFTYEPKRNSWTAVFLEQDRSTTIFRASGPNANHIVYRSVYPDASMTEIFDRTSPTRYTLQFTQSTGGKTTKSADTCVKT